MTAEIQLSADGDPVNGLDFENAIVDIPSQAEFDEKFVGIVNHLIECGFDADSNDVLNQAVAELMLNPAENMCRQIDYLASHYAGRIISGQEESIIFATRKVRRTKDEPNEIEEIYTITKDANGSDVYRYSMNAATYPLFDRPYTLEVRQGDKDITLYVDYGCGNEPVNVCVEPRQFECYKAFEQLFRSAIVAVAAVGSRSDKERRDIDENVKTMLSAQLSNVKDLHRIRDLTTELPS